MPPPVGDAAAPLQALIDAEAALSDLQIANLRGTTFVRANALPHSPAFQALKLPRTPLRFAVARVTLSALGAWLGGWLYDVTGDYQAMLVTGLIMALVSPLSLWLAAPRKPNPAPASV